MAIDWDALLEEIQAEEESVNLTMDPELAKKKLRDIVEKINTKMRETPVRRRLETREELERKQAQKRLRYAFREFIRKQKERA